MWGDISLCLWFAFLCVEHLFMCLLAIYTSSLEKAHFLFSCRTCFFYDTVTHPPGCHILLAKSSRKVAAYRILGSLLHGENATTSWESGNVLTMSVSEKQMTPKILKAPSHKTLYILFLVPKHHTNLQYIVKESSNLSVSRALSSLIFWSDSSFLI